MTSPASIIVPIVVLGFVYVLLPVALDTYRRFRQPRTLVCPETREPAQIELDASRAAISALDGAPVVQIRQCSRWPEHAACGRECLGQVGAV